MKFLLPLLFLFSCNKQLEPSFIPTLPLLTHPIGEEYVKIPSGASSYYVSFDAVKTISLVEVDRLMINDEFVRIEMCNVYDIATQQTFVLENNTRFVIITVSLESPLYISFK